MHERLTVRGGLAAETVPFHTLLCCTLAMFVFSPKLDIFVCSRSTYTSKAHSTTNPPDIHPLPRSEPARAHRLAHPNVQPVLALDFELGHPPLRADLGTCKVSQHGLGHIASLFLARADLHSPVPVLGPCFVCDDFVAVELQDCACCAFACGGVVDGCHAALESEEAGAEGRAMRFPL
jgi:hypothetical protein